MEAPPPTSVRYALLQTTLQCPAVDALRRAFESVRVLTAVDAPAVARDAYGILVKNLSPDDAAVLHQALTGQGVPTEIVPEKLLPVLPPSKFVRQFEFGEDTLLVADPLGRKIPIEYRHLLLLAVGELEVTEIQRRTTPDLGNSSSSFRTSSALRFELELEGPRETRSRQVRARRHFIEILLGGGAARFTVEVDRNAHLLFRALGNEAASDLTQNLSALVRRFHGVAPRLLLNRGAFALRQDSPSSHIYPSRNAFHEEILWMLWQADRHDYQASEPG